MIKYKRVNGPLLTGCFLGSQSPTTLVVARVCCAVVSHPSGHKEPYGLVPPILFVRIYVQRWQGYLIVPVLTSSVLMRSYYPMSEKLFSCPGSEKLFPVQQLLLELW